jgi:hypothetical protein
VQELRQLAACELCFQSRHTGPEHHYRIRATRGETAWRGNWARLAFAPSYQVRWPHVGTKMSVIGRFANSEPGHLGTRCNPQCTFRYAVMRPSQTQASEIEGRDPLRPGLSKRRSWQILEPPEEDKSSRANGWLSAHHCPGPAPCGSWTACA